MTRKTKELKEMANEDLAKRLKELKKELVKENAQVATGATPKNPKKIRDLRKNVARILTIMKQREEK